MDDACIGGSGLLRIAGLPIRYWLVAANPRLFDQISLFEREEEARDTEARLLAGRIGEVLIPDPALTRETRAFLLAIRRRLHRGEAIGDVSCTAFYAVSASSGVAGELIQALVARVERDRSVAGVLVKFEAEVAKEEERLFRLPQDVLRDSPIARSFLQASDESRPSRNQKQRRHRFEHEWHRIIRAATGTTPRDWMSHVALIPVGPPAGFPPVVRAQYTAQWTSNVRTRRLPLTEPPVDWPKDESRLAMNPLHWDSGGDLVVAVMNSDGLAHVSVRHTILLDAVCENLTETALTFGALVRTLGCHMAEDRLALHAFVRHLLSLGILQTSEPPIVRLERPATPGISFTEPAASGDGRSGWIDVYRYADGGIPGSTVRNVQAGSYLAWRLMHQLQLDAIAMHEQTAPTIERTWMFTDILCDELSARQMSTADDNHSVEAGDVSSLSATPLFSTFLGEVKGRFESTTGIIIDGQWLDECGISQDEPNWPFDCLVRVPAEGTDFAAILDQLSPPGLLDARFADTLADIHGVVPQVEAYREFLRQLEELTGILFVEVLTPPLSDGAANAVRRPLYTSAWTGDPLEDIYFRPRHGPDRYIPLHAIRIRRTGGVLRADVNGQPIWLIHHATRSFSPPWDRIARVLLATAPPMLPGGFPRMRDLLVRGIDGPMMPRVSLSGGIVLSPAQWRIPADQLWQEGDSMTTRIRRLIRLRDRYLLPRWVYLVSGGDESLVPCDLESVYALRTIERHMRGRTQMHLIELLPSPDQLLVKDGAHRKEDRLASQILLRFPYNESPRALADRIAPAIIAAFGGADLPQRVVMGSSKCRGPPARWIELIETGMYPFVKESRHVTGTETSLQT